MMNFKVKTLLSEPIVLFILIGSVLYLLQALVFNTDPSARKQIIVTSEQLQQLENGFANTWMRPPTQNELEGLLADHIRNEVFYREALAMGLDENDQVIRNRLRQKLELLMDNMASVNVPSEQMLEAFLQEHADDFKKDYQVSFIQVFVNPELQSDPRIIAENLLDQLRDGASPEDLGDRTMMGYAFPEYSQTDVGRRFGTDFAMQIMLVKSNDWSGPLNSGIGLHLIRIDHFEEGTLPELSEIRKSVEREWMARQKSELKAAAYEKLLEGYDVQIEEKGDSE
jgi:hypothetical protein